MKRLLLGPLAVLISTSCAVEKPAPITKPVVSTLVDVVDFQQEFLKRINKVRAEGCNCGKTFMPPAPPLAWNNQLQMSAMGHAQDMARNKYFSHVSKNGNKIKERITAGGYTHEGFQSYTIGENIAWGQRSIKEVMKGWLDSENHCKNLMNPAFMEIGVAMENYYWVQNFGGRIPFKKRNSR